MKCLQYARSANKGFIIMGSFASKLCVQCASILWSSISASMTRSIPKIGLRRLSNSWSPRNCFSHWISTTIEWLLEQTQAKEVTTVQRICSVGATNDCKDCEICDTVENENTPICGRGIFTTKHENWLGKLQELVIKWTVWLLSILSCLCFSSNYLLVKHG